MGLRLPELKQLLDETIIASGQRVVLLGSFPAALIASRCLGRFLFFGAKPRLMPIPLFVSML
jgi:hypothetical protein